MTNNTKSGIENNSLARFYNYETIPLKLYLEIADSADYSKLIIEGTADIDQCFQAWDSILHTSSKSSGTLEYRSYFENLKHYNRLLKDYNTIKATITILYFEIDNEMIEFLRTKGYKIITDGPTPRTSYVKSLNAAMTKSNSLISRIEMRSNQIMKAAEASKGSNKQDTFETLMANLTVALGFTIDDSLTLSRYNEYNKILKKKHEASSNKKK